MSIALAVGLLLWSPCRAGLSAGDAARLDGLYLHRNEPAQLDLALRQLEAALKAEPQDEAALWRYGRALVAQGEAAPSGDKNAKLALFKQAETALNQAVALSPRDAQAHYWLARELAGSNEILRKLGLARQMRKELETAISLDPGLAAAHRLYGELLRELPGLFGGDKQKSVRELEEALRLAPNDTANYPSLAESYLAVGRKKDAIDTLNAVFRVANPDDPAAAAQDLQDARGLLARVSPPQRSLWQRVLRSSGSLFTGL